MPNSSQTMQEPHHHGDAADHEPVVVRRSLLPTSWGANCGAPTVRQPGILVRPVPRTAESIRRRPSRSGATTPSRPPRHVVNQAILHLSGWNRHSRAFPPSSSIGS